MKKSKVSDFTKTVIKKILQIPKGRVATYKQIAELSGKPQASRGVSWILHSCATLYKLPWHRVLSSQGRISFERHTHNFREQRRLLRSEGIKMTEDGQLDLSQFQWKKRPTKPRSKTNGPKMFS